jgi:peptide deformylase
MEKTTFPMMSLGNPILRTKSKTVSLKEVKTQRFQKFLDKLVRTCLKNDGVGIAAPQKERVLRMI